MEYENVAIILGKDFGQDKDLFELYFKNLGLLYIDDFGEIKDGLEKILEKAYAFTNEIAIDNF